MRKAVMLIVVGLSGLALSACASTESASNLTWRSVELHASGTYDGSAGHVEFEYSAKAADIGTRKAKRTAADYFAARPAGTRRRFNTLARRLKPDTVYYYAVCGADARVQRTHRQDHCGPVEHFRTLPAPQWVTLNGSPARLAFSASSNVATVAFHGTKGRVVAPLYTTASGFHGSVNVSLRDPSGNQLPSSGNLTHTLPADGVYTVLVKLGGQAATIGLGVYEDPALTTTEDKPTLDVPIVADQPTSVSFTGTAGDEIRWTWQPEANYSLVGIPTVTLEDSSGNIVLGTHTTMISDAFPPVKLPATGTYHLVFDSKGSTGVLALNLYKTIFQTGSITVNGPSVTATDSVGQASMFSFTGTAGEKVGLTFGATIPQGVEIQDPSGAAVPGTNYVYTLPVDGTYNVVIDPGYAVTTSLALSSPPIQTPPGTIIVNGPAVDVTVPTPSDSAKLTFSGTAGEQVSAEMGIVKITLAGFPTLSIEDSTGNVLPGGSYTGCCRGVGPVTLPSDGTYTLVLSGNNVAAGTASLHLVSP